MRAFIALCSMLLLAVGLPATAATAVPVSEAPSRIVKAHLNAERTKLTFEKDSNVTVKVKARESRAGQPRKWTTRRDHLELPWPAQGAVEVRIIKVG